MKVVCLVANSISKDARVIKVAGAIASGGDSVVVVGLQDQNNRIVSEAGPNGINYIRFPWKGVAYRSMAKLVALAVGLLVISLLTVLVLGWVSPLILSLILLFGLCFFGIFYIPVKFVKIAKRYEDLYEKPVRSLIKEEVLAPKRKKGSIFFRRLFSDLSLSDLLVRMLSGAYRSREFVRHALGESPDVIHCNDITTLMAGVKIKKKSGAKLVYDAHEYYEGSAGLSAPQRLVFCFIHWYASRFIDCFFVVNQSIGELYSCEYKKMPVPIVIMNATRNVPCGDYDGRLHSAAELSEKTKIVLFQGGFTKYRGIEKLIDSVKFFDKDWALVLMGWGNMEDALRSQADEVMRKFPDAHIVFLKPAKQSELSCWTSGASVGVILYEDVGINHKFCTPNKLWEFPSSKVPVLVTPRVEMKKAVSSYKFGVVIQEPFGPEAVWGCLKKVVDHSESYIEGCEDFLKNNCWEQYEKRIVTAYKDLTATIS